MNAGATGCTQARSLIVDAFTAFVQRPYSFQSSAWGAVWLVNGWRCSHGLGGSQAFCRLGNIGRIDGSFRHDDGWSF